jgi:hypothetical protein
MPGIIRHAAKVRIRQLIEDRIADASVAVLLAPTAREAQLDTIYLGTTTGETVVPVVRSGRKVYDDAFTVDVWLLTAGEMHATYEASGARLEELVNAVHDTLAESWWLQETPGGEALPGVYEATVSFVEGPDAVPDSQFPSMVAHMTVTIKTRVT